MKRVRWFASVVAAGASWVQFGPPCPAQTPCTGPPTVCGQWAGPYDWGILACPAFPPNPSCAPGYCGANFGEIPHGVLIINDPLSRPQTWRVLFWNAPNLNPPTTLQPWWVWDAATPGSVTKGEPDVPGVLFCGGHDLLEDGPCS